MEYSQYSKFKSLLIQLYDGNKLYIVSRTCNIPNPYSMKYMLLGMASEVGAKFISISAIDEEGSEYYSENRIPVSDITKEICDTIVGGSVKKVEIKTPTEVSDNVIYYNNSFYLLSPKDKLRIEKSLELEEIENYVVMGSKMAVSTYHRLYIVNLKDLKQKNVETY